jgi:hypothetical protein
MTETTRFRKESDVLYVRERIDRHGRVSRDEWRISARRLRLDLRDVKLVSSGDYEDHVSDNVSNKHAKALFNTKRCISGVGVLTGCKLAVLNLLDTEATQEIATVRVNLSRYAGSRPFEEASLRSAVSLEQRAKQDADAGRPANAAPHSLRRYLERASGVLCAPKKDNKFELSQQAPFLDLVIDTDIFDAAWEQLCCTSTEKVHLITLVEVFESEKYYSEFGSAEYAIECDQDHLALPAYIGVVSQPICPKSKGGVATAEKVSDSEARLAVAADLISKLLDQADRLRTTLRTVGWVIVAMLIAIAIRV